MKLCQLRSEFNKCKGGDLVIRNVLEKGVGTTLEVVC